MNRNLKLRIITALIGAPAILLLLLGLGVEGISFFVWVISCGMLFEYSKMFFSLEDSVFKTALLLIFNTLIHFLSYWMAVPLPPLLMGLAPVFLFFSCFLLMVPKLLHYQGADGLNSESGEALIRKHVEELMALVFGWMYCGWGPLLLVSIYLMPAGKFWVLLTLLTVWSCDTFAYFAGKYFGSHKLYESVSPKKTWEGLIGGMLGAVLVAVLFAHFYLPDSHAVTIALVAVTISVSSAVGDLCESLIKRAAKVKDSSGILPGHGGFLDRFDGVVFAIPVMYLLLNTIL